MFIWKPSGHNKCCWHTHRCCVQTTFGMITCSTKINIRFRALLTCLLTCFAQTSERYDFKIITPTWRGKSTTRSIDQASICLQRLRYEDDTGKPRTQPTVQMVTPLPAFIPFLPLLPSPPVAPRSFVPPASPCAWAGGRRGEGRLWSAVCEAWVMNWTVFF